MKHVAHSIFYFAFEKSTANENDIFLLHCGLDDCCRSWVTEQEKTNIIIFRAMYGIRTPQGRFAT
jgi:hypothetical protein